MNLTDADIIARDLVLHHLGADWWVRWNNKKSVLGSCHYKEQIIFLSKAFMAVNDEKQLRDTVLHEIAHAKVGPDHGHDRVWKVQALALGARPVRCAAAPVAPKYNWIGRCPLGHLHKRYRLAVKIQRGDYGVSCGICTPGQYDKRYPIEWKRA